MNLKKNEDFQKSEKTLRQAAEVFSKLDSQSMINHLGKLQQIYNTLSEFTLKAKMKQTSLGYATKAEKLFLTIQDLKLATKTQENLFQYFRHSAQQKCHFQHCWEGSLNMEELAVGYVKSLQLKIDFWKSVKNEN